LENIMTFDFNSEYAAANEAPFYTWTPAGMVSANGITAPTVGPDDGYDWLREVATRLNKAA
jgi:hypothetical protein